MNVLKSEQRIFFQQLAVIAFTNPFGSERENLECKLLNISTGKMSTQGREIEIQKLTRQHLLKAEPNGNFHIGRYTETTLEYMTIAWLFYTFHEQQYVYDRFIELQSQQDSEVPELPDAESLVATFIRAGFSDQDAAKYIALVTTRPLNPLHYQPRPVE